MTESEIAVLISRLDSVKEQVEESKEEANKWRERFDEKIQLIQVSIAMLPCPARIEITKGIKTQLSWLWAVICTIVAAIVAEWTVRR